MRKNILTILLFSVIVIFSVLISHAYIAGIMSYSGPEITPVVTSTINVFAVGTNGQVLVVSSTAVSGMEWENQIALNGSLKTNNLSDLTSTSSARTNIGYSGGTLVTISSTGTISTTAISTSSINFGTIASSTFNIGAGLSMSSSGTLSNTGVLSNPGWITTSSNLGTGNFNSANISQWTDNSNYVVSSSISGVGNILWSSATGSISTINSSTFPGIVSVGSFNSSGTGQFWNTLNFTAATGTTNTSTLGTTFFQYVSATGTNETVGGIASTSQLYAGSSTFSLSSLFLATTTFKGITNVTGTLDTVSVCGVGPTVRGTAGKGQVTWGTNTGSSTCIVTFSSAFQVAPFCVANWSGGGSSTLGIQTSSTVSQVTFITATSSLTSGAKTSYFCWSNF